MNRCIIAQQFFDCFVNQSVVLCEPLGRPKVAEKSENTFPDPNWPWFHIYFTDRGDPLRG